METSAKVPTTSSRMRGHDSRPHKVRSHKLRSSTNERNSSSTPSTVPEVPVKLDPEELRRARAEYYNASTGDRRRNTHKKMASDYSKRREPAARVSSWRDSNKTSREVRESHSSEHRRRRRKPHDSEGGGNESIVYVYKPMGNCTSKGDPRSAPRLRRISGIAGRSNKDFDEERRVAVEDLRTTTRGRRSHYPERQKVPVRTDEHPVARPAPRRTRSYYPGRDRPLLHTEDRPTSRAATRSRTGATITRSTSVRENSYAPVARPSLMRSQTTSRRVRHTSSTLPALPSGNGEVKRAPSIARTNDNSSGFFGSLLFSSPKPVRPEKQIECLTCLSTDIPISKSAKLSCEHRMCNSCLRRIFTLSVTDPQHMPPKCCTQDHIPLKYVEKLFDTKFKMKWNQKYQEYTTKNRIYCPARGCGEWIKPANIHLDTSGGANGGRKYGKCGRCRTKVCCTCNGKWHARRECPKDEATQRFAEIAKEEGWQRCFNCSATVELKEGCNHMTCRCRAEFCMVCGLKWKTCDCPWFNYEAVENDRLNHMNPPQVRRVPVNQQRGYQEELERRREQERRDEALARRMQVLGIDLQTGNNHNQNRNIHHNQDVVDLGNAPHHVVNQHFLRRAADLMSRNYNTDQTAIAIGMMNELNPPPPPPPPPERQQSLNILRHHSSASRQHNNNPRVRASERVVPGRMQTNYESEAQRHRPAGENDGRKVGGGGKRHSTLAGLTRGTAEGRVDEWRRHIGDD